MWFKAAPSLKPSAVLVHVMCVCLHIKMCLFTDWHRSSSTNQQDVSDYDPTSSHLASM